MTDHYTVIDFKELPADGVRFEQLVRELLLVDNLSPHWTGVGPDDGRDLIVKEAASGPLGTFTRRWLVQCKHFAHAGRVVGRADIGDFTKDCRQIMATGYLLACSTTVSAAAMRYLEETGDAEGITTSVWDGVTLEGRLLRPHSFRTAQQFFPISLGKSPWQIYRVDAGALGGQRPAWAAHYRDNLLYLSQRVSSTFPSLKVVERIVQQVQAVQGLGEGEFLRLRGVYYDDKNGNYSVYLDYMVRNTAPHPRLTPQRLEDQLGPGVPLDADLYNYLVGESQTTDSADAEATQASTNSVSEEQDTSRFGSLWVDWDTRLVEYSPYSDHYDPDHHDYYPVADLREMASGGTRLSQLADQAYSGEWVNGNLRGESAFEERGFAAYLAERRARRARRINPNDEGGA
jgi:hypothetical protein